MIVVDASFAVKLLLPEADSELAREKWEAWANAREVIIAPAVFPVEVASVIRKSVHRGRIVASDGDIAFAEMGRLGVEIREPSNLLREAWNIAKHFNRPAMYDSCYLALAAIVGCDFWTADLRLANTVGSEFSWVQALR